MHTSFIHSNTLIYFRVFIKKRKKISLPTIEHYFSRIINQQTVLSYISQTNKPFLAVMQSTTQRKLDLSINIREIHLKAKDSCSHYITPGDVRRRARLSRRSTMAATHGPASIPQDQESRPSPAQRPNDAFAAVLGIGTANPANCLRQDEYADWYFRVTKSDHLTTLNNKLKRICTTVGCK